MSYDHDDNTVFDMEFKWEENDAWYGVGVLVNMETETATVKFKGFPAMYDLKLTADGFKTAAEVDEFVNRFRPCSQQLQDTQCSKKIIKGLTVCASYEKGDDELRFYDAVVEAVHHKEHSFENGEEVCLCSFVVMWLHGPSCGNLTPLSIESMCNIVQTDQVDPRIALFSNFAKEKINENKSDSSQNELQDVQYVSEEANNTHYFILIGNIEKDLLASSIEQFIHQQTSISSHAYVFPSLLEEPFARGIIIVDCSKKIEEIYDFLNNPNHLIVSKNGRPWVILEHGSREQPFGSFTEDNFESKIVEQGLSVVHSDSEAYRRATHLKNNFVAFIDYQRGLYKKFVFNENKILQS